MGAVTKFLEFAMEHGLIKDMDKTAATNLETVLEEKMNKIAQGEAGAVLDVLKTMRLHGAELGPLGESLLDHIPDPKAQEVMVNKLLLTDKGRKMMADLVSPDAASTVQGVAQALGGMGRNRSQKPLNQLINAAGQAIKTKPVQVGLALTTAYAVVEGVGHLWAEFGPNGTVWNQRDQLGVQSRAATDTSDPSFADVKKRLDAARMRGPVSP